MTEWDQRQLCSDGGCVGVIGDDGTCKVCGRAAPNWGDERKRGLVEPSDAEEDLADEDALPADQGPAAPDDEAWHDRKLCPDDSCIGVIGEDGKCKVCGKAAA